jgi:hypothetical protein
MMSAAAFMTGFLGWPPASNASRTCGMTTLLRTGTGSGEVSQSYSRLGLVEDDLFKALTADERAALYGLLSRAVEALAPAHAPPGCAAPEAAAGLAPRLAGDCAAEE